MYVDHLERCRIVVNRESTPAAIVVDRVSCVAAFWLSLIAESDDCSEIRCF